MDYSIQSLDIDQNPDKAFFSTPDFWPNPLYTEVVKSQEQKFATEMGIPSLHLLVQAQQRKDQNNV